MQSHLHPTWPARAALIAAVPASAVAAGASARAPFAGLLCGLIVIALAGVAALVGPRALGGASRLMSAVIALEAAAALWIGGIVWLLIAIVSLCSDASIPLAATFGAAAVVYVPGSILALRDIGRVWWAWPLVVVLAIATSLIVLALLTGGPHSCPS
ncbi:MAG TPA: hypothetical protein VGL44_07955 [Gaiellales bacterium]|jgi:hypothetical protein